MSQKTPVHGSSLAQHRSLGRVARKGAMWAYLRTGVFALVGIPTTIILARLLTPTDFGIAAAAVFFGQLASRLSSGGMGQALVRVKDLREDHISTVFVINAAMGAVGTLALIVAAPFVGAFYGAPEVGWLLPLVAVNFALGTLTMVQQCLLSRDLRYKEIATIGSLDLAVASIAAVVFAVFGFGFWSLVLGDVCGGAVKLAYGVKVVGWHARLRFSPAAARELSSFALGSYAKRLLEHFTINIDNLVVGRTLGITALGFYDKAFSAANNVFAKMTVVGPAVSFRIFAIIQDEPERFRRAYRKVIMTATLAAYVVFGTLGVMAPHLIVVALGEQWRPSVVAFQILCVSFSLKVLSQYATQAALARGWVWSLVWRQVVQVVCVVVGVYFASSWGIDFAAAAVLGASIAMFFMTQTMMRAATSLGWMDILEPQVPALLTTAVLGSLLWTIDVLFASRTAPFVVLMAQGSVAAVFMLAFAWWCPFREARDLMHEVVGDLSPRLAASVWKDVAAANQAAKAAARARRASEFDAMPPGVDAGTGVAS